MNTVTEWWRWLGLVLFSLWLGNPGWAQEEAPHEQYRVLEWQDLIPEGWEAPLVATAFDEVAKTGIDSASVVQALDGQLAALPAAGAATTQPSSSDLLPESSEYWFPGKCRR